MKALLVFVAIVGTIAVLSSGILPYRLVKVSPTENSAPDSEVTAQPLATAQPSPTIVVPNSAEKATAEATRLYPALAQKGSAFNKTFLTLYEQAKKDDPRSLAVPDWPLALAARAALLTGVHPVASNYDVQTAQRPAENVTVTPPVVSAADLRAMEYGMKVMDCVVTRVHEKGCEVSTNNVMWTDSAGHEAALQVSMQTIFVAGLTGHADGEQIQRLRIYPTGRFARNGGSTVRCYASTPQSAVGQIQNDGANVQAVVSADFTVWMAQQSGDGPVSSMRRIGGG